MHKVEAEGERQFGFGFGFGFKWTDRGWVHVCAGARTLKVVPNSPCARPGLRGILVHARFAADGGALTLERDAVEWRSSIRTGSPSTGWPVSTTVRSRRCSGGRIRAGSQTSSPSCAVPPRPSRPTLLEAMGEWRPGKRLLYMGIAKGSTWECWAHVDTLLDFGLIDLQAAAPVRDKQRQITALLITTIRNLEAQIKSE